MAEADVDPLQRWGKENSIQDSTIEALNEAGFELDDLPHVTESDINELNDGKGIATGHKRRLLTRISHMMVNSTNSGTSGVTSKYKINLTIFTITLYW